ncbi:S-layer homology domain-containing protein [Lachnospiraceae bacterium 46-61]
MMKKYISFLLAGAMSVSATMVSFGANFSDINNVPWPGAETYINQAADANLMVGENIDGKMVFRAKDPVTLVETAQLVYNLLKATNHLENKTDLPTKWNTTLKEASIPEWAYTSVSYCLETGVITAAEAKTFVSGTTNVQATREQVAGMIGKAIAGVDTSISANSTTTKFGDNSAIASDKIAYVALLSDKSILSGDDLGNFNPKNKINRTEMAVMMTKSNDVLKNITKVPEKPAEPELPTTGTFTAQIEQMQSSGSNVMLALYNGTSVMGYMGDSTVPTTYKDGTTGNFNDVTVGMSVTITYNGSRITKMVINADAPKKEEQVLKGNIANISKDEIRIIKGQPYYFASGVVVTIDGKDKSVKDLMEKFEDKDVTEIYVELTLDSREDVSKVVAKTKAKSYEDSGTIKKLTTSKITFEDGTNYKIDKDDITVKFDGSSISLDKAIDKINDADDDDDFTAEVEINEDDDNYIDRLEIKSKSSSNSTSGSGTIKSVSGKKITVGSKTYTTTSSTDFDIDDGDNSDIDSLSDLETAVEDDDKTIEVKVTVKDDEVTKITGYVAGLKGELFEVRDDEIIVDLDSGKYTYQCKSSVDIDAGNCDDLDDLYDYNKDEGRIQVEITINSSNQVTKIKER